MFSRRLSMTASKIWTKLLEHRQSDYQVMPRDRLQHSLALMRRDRGEISSFSYMYIAPIYGMAPYVEIVPANIQTNIVLQHSHHTQESRGSCPYPEATTRVDQYQSYNYHTAQPKACRQAFLLDPSCTNEFEKVHFFAWPSGKQ